MPQAIAPPLPHAPLPLAAAGQDAGARWLPHVFVALALLKFAMALHHVPWLDELQVLALAREMRSPADVYWLMRYEGHPPLWHLMVRAAIAVHDHPRVLTALALACSLATTALILFRAPFPPLARVLLALSYPVLFEYGFVARSYSAILLLVVAVAAFRQQRLAWLAVALLPWLSVQAALLGLVLAALLWRDGNRSWPGALALLVGLLLVPLFVAPPPDLYNALVVKRETLTFASVAQLLPLFGALVVTAMVDGLPPGWSDLMDAPLLNALCVALMLQAIWALFSRDRLALALVALFMATTAGLHLLVYQLNIRHVGLVAVLVLAVAWMTPALPRGNLAGVRVWLAVQAAFGLIFALGALLKPLSAGAALAATIAAAPGPARPVIAEPAFVGVEVAARLGVRTVNLDNACRASFHIWRAPMPAGALPAALAGPLATQAAAVASAGGGAAWLVTTDRLASTLLARLGPDARLVARFPEAMSVPLALLEVRAISGAPELSLPDCGT
jgi:hypothetical protein